MLPYHRLRSFNNTHLYSDRAAGGLAKMKLTTILISPGPWLWLADIDHLPMSSLCPGVSSSHKVIGPTF